MITSNYFVCSSDWIFFVILSFSESTGSAAGEGGEGGDEAELVAVNSGGEERGRGQ